MPDTLPARVRFGLFELDLKAGELRLGELKVILQDQPFQILRMLVEHAGEVVSREEIQKQLWSDDVIVDFDTSINQAVMKLRRVLSDLAGNEQYIETVAKRGYRLKVSVEWVGPSEPLPNNALPETNFNPTNGVLLEGMIWHRVAVFVLAAVLLGVGLHKARPALARFYNNRGVKLQRKGEIKDAMSNYGLAVRIDSSYAAAHYNLADAYEEISGFEKAADQYQRAIEADPTFYEAYNNLARLYIMRRKDYEAALRLLDRALSFQPQEPSVQYSLRKNYGWAKFELGLRGQAENDLRLALSLDPTRGAAHCLLAKVLDAQGRGSDALFEWEACTAYSDQAEVEAEWRVEGQERLSKEVHK